MVRTYVYGHQVEEEEAEVVHRYDSRITLSMLGVVAGDLQRGAAWFREAWVMACKIHGAEHQEAVKEKELLDLAERAVAAASVRANQRAQCLLL